MNRRRCLRIGLCGSAVAALCCFTPVAVVLFTALGLGAAVGWLDLVLLPLLVLFLGLALYGAFGRESRT